MASSSENPFAGDSENPFAVSYYDRKTFLFRDLLLRSSDQARLKISLVYFRILQWPRTPVMRLVDLKTSIPLQNKILHKQAVLQRFFICLFLFPVRRSFVPPVIIK